MVWGDCLIFGTKDLEFKTKKAGLYLFRMKDRKLTKLAGGQICSNGKVITKSDNGALTLLDIDTPTKTVAGYSIDIDAGKLGERRVVLDCKDQPGFPDGMTSSPDQKSIFISFYNPDFAPNGETRQFNLADGSVIASYHTPNAPQATCPQLCKIAGKVYLIITTAVEHMTPDRLAQSIDSGSLFCAETEYAEGTDTQKLIVD
jgi:sugar lactone lactonase YvrE